MTLTANLFSIVYKSWRSGLTNIIYSLDLAKYSLDFIEYKLDFMKSKLYFIFYS